MNIHMSSGKKNVTLRNEFFSKVFEQLTSIKELYYENSFLIIYGPGFTKEDFLNYIEKKEKLIVSKAIIKETSSIGTSGFLEILRKGNINDIISNIRIEKEEKYMDRLLLEIAVDGRASYGLNNTKRLIEIGAVEVLLITDDYLKRKRMEKNNDLFNIDNLLKNVEISNGKIVILSSKFDPGIKLNNIGGIGAILRYKIDIN